MLSVQDWYVKVRSYYTAIALQCQYIDYISAASHRNITALQVKMYLSSCDTAQCSNIVWVFSAATQRNCGVVWTDLYRHENFQEKSRNSCSFWSKFTFSCFGMFRPFWQDFLIFIKRLLCLLTGLCSKGLIIIMCSMIDLYIVLVHLEFIHPNHVDGTWVHEGVKICHGLDDTCFVMPLPSMIWKGSTLDLQREYEFLME